MTIRGLGVIVLLALLGVAVGAGIAYLSRAEARVLDTASPVPAVSPSIPVDPPPEIRPDPLLPPLATDVETRPATIGTAPFDLTFPVPEGWERVVIGPAEDRWVLPGNPDHTYHLRVESVFSQRLTVRQQRDRREEELAGLTALSFLEHSDDTLVFSYVDETLHLRLGIVRWVQPRNSGVAELEIATTGRMRDEEGMRALVERVGNEAQVSDP